MVSDVMIWSPIEMVLTGIGLSLHFICVLMLMFSIKKKESFNEKIIILGFAGLLTCWGLAKIYFIGAMLSVPGEFIDGTFYGEFLPNSLEFDTFMRIGHVFMMASYILLIYPFERVIKRTRYIMTIETSIVTIIASISTPMTTLYTLYDLYSTINAPIIFLIFFSFARNSERRLKTVFFIYLFGAVLLSNGYSLQISINFKTPNVIPLIVSPLFYILGIVLLSLPIFLAETQLKKATPYWIGFGLIAIFVELYIIIFGIVYNFQGFALLAVIVVTFFLIYLFILIIKTMKEEDSEVNFSEDKQDIFKSKPDIVGLFSRPQKITEQEIAISKEKRICLVCKNEIARECYNCPECKAFYCLKCSTTLAGMENACWVCETPFDESKPINLLSDDTLEDMSNLHDMIQKSKRGEEK